LNLFLQVMFLRERMQYSDKTNNQIKTAVFEMILSFVSSGKNKRTFITVLYKALNLVFFFFRKKEELQERVRSFFYKKKELQERVKNIRG
jgi:hypothetical protein